MRSRFIILHTFILVKNHMHSILAILLLMTFNLAGTKTSVFKIYLFDND